MRIFPPARPELVEGLHFSFSTEAPEEGQCFDKLSTSGDSI